MTAAIDHRLLRQFLAVARCGSVRAAAGVLHISQPPLTQAMQRLEADLGVVLFTRHATGMVLTPAGRCLAGEAEAILARLERAGQRVQAVARGPAPLRVGFVSAALSGTLQALLAALRADAGPVPKLAELTTPQQVEALANGQLDIGLLHPPIALDDLVVQSLGRDPYWVALPQRHPLAKRTRLTFCDVAAEPLVLFPPEQGPALMTTLHRLALRCGPQPLRVVAQAPRVHSQLAIVASGIGLGLITRSTARTLRFEGVVTRPLIGVAHELHVELAMVASVQLMQRFGQQVASSWAAPGVPGP